MKALLYANTQVKDYTCQLPEILATGDSDDSQELLEQFSDSLALLMDERWDTCTFHIWSSEDESKHTITGDQVSFAEVVEAFFKGNKHELSVDVPDSSAEGYMTENWAIREVPSVPRSHLVKTVKTEAGTVEPPVIIASGTEVACVLAMESVKNDSCEHFDGGNGHWEYLGSNGEFVCYDIIEE